MFVPIRSLVPRDLSYYWGPLSSFDRDPFCFGGYGLGNFEREMTDVNRTLNHVINHALRPFSEALQEIQTDAQGEMGPAATLKNDKDKFEVSLGVSQFKPQELQVKVADNCLVIEGKHEEKSDAHGFISPHFVRRYVLPEDVDQAGLNSVLDEKGVLTIAAPKMAQLPGNERPIPIQQKQQPALTNQEKTAEQK